ncbi:hypothetical protein JCM8547_004998 [Rhodosporidiobolus lusitaniae]
MPFEPTAAPPVEIPPHLATQRLGKPGLVLLRMEREGAAFDPTKLKVYLYGSEYVERMRRILAIVEKEPAFDKTHIHYMGRGDRFRHGLRKEKRLSQLTVEHGWTSEDVKMAENLIDLPATFRLHREMYLKTLREQTTDEQKELFTKPSERFEMIGCYAQTELAHGSNVQALETTATYDPKRQVFVIQSPSITAMKWWAGGLGRSADHAVVMCQLYTPDGKDNSLVRRGPFPFVIPLRDRKTRALLPGRTIMDIGPKAGFGSVDNGAALFDKVEVPHVNFLARFAQVEKETGVFRKPKHEKVAYGTMVYIRANLVKDAGQVLARAATVAIRYCAIRQQFADRDDSSPNAQETAVLNYQLVQARVFPPLVQAFACQFTGRAMHRLYELNQSNMAKGDFSLLPDLHAMSCSLKSLCTIMASGAIEECRRACGGHGYSMASGLVEAYTNYLPTVTWEGDSYMLTQQVSKYQLATFRTLYKNPQAETSKESFCADYVKKYLADPKATAQVEKPSDLSDPQFFITAFGHRAAYLVGNALHKRDVQKRSWNSLLVDFYRCSVAHSQYYLVRNFAEAIFYDNELKKQPDLHKVMTTCFLLFACHTMDSEASEFLSSGYLLPKGKEILRDRVDALLAELRPQAVPLVDAWAIPDFWLNSALGRYDGDVYPSLVKFAQNEPLNRTRFNVNIDDEEVEVGPEEGIRAWEGKGERVSKL